MPLIDIMTMCGMLPYVEEHLLPTELDGANLLKYAITTRARSITRSM